MDLLIGAVMILGMVAVAYLAPEIVVILTGKPKHFKRLVRLPNDQRAEPMAGRRRNARPGTRLNSL